MSKSNRFRGVALSLSFLAALKVGTAAPLDVATSYDIFLYGSNGTTSISQLTVNGGVAVGNVK